MATAAIPKQAAYKSLPLAGLIPELVPPVNLYLPAEASRTRLYRSAELPIQSTDIESLRARGVEELLVNACDYAQIKDFFASNLGAILCDETHTPQQRLRLLNQVVSDTLRDTFTSEDINNIVDKTKEMATFVVDVCMQSEIAVREVAMIANHDYCTFTHSANVATYATLLAKSLGLTDQDDLHRIAAAGMLHDLGKLKIPQQILAKPGRLTKEEFAVVRLHPTRGFQMLRNQDLTRGQLMMVYQHHEWMNGKGYPVGCVGEETHYWARICAVVDVFEALTGIRPYRRPTTMTETIAIMERESGTHFDEEILRCWKSHFAEVLK